ncbi:MAG: hypothetical protein B7Z40_08595 [Bosea sp. 12-68-7]|nr:MAG: hypothetical protein B7Z40_08595 [Bosea sp. 12-68-7]
MSVLKPIKSDFVGLGQDVFGDGWRYRLAAHFGVAARTVHRWADNAKDPDWQPPAEILAFLRDQAETLQTVRLQERIGEIARHQIDSGQLHPNVVAAVLQDLADAFKTAERPKDKAYKPVPKEG